ncbi:bacillithiol system redox-active protein YtxJ [Metabacillus malikii]|uniref:Bacillithiol system protein YtxJ n=1 Tax=Metabacillus malikii TaxID=1504265 RepID=A0ABT9ZGQ7_9BACI|nr:bacillithiol system redox-active protein YtxJ [Metabacillus malikii]MDQ0231079.1 bacillithiol system protein YtxJ [Metabacillus malikii]
MSKTLIGTKEEFQQLLDKHDTFLFVKNSLTCPISQAAFAEFESFSEANGDYPCYFLHVQEARPLSDYIAETYGIKHESPQALLFKGSNVIWNTSHHKITKQALEAEVLGK